MRTLLFDCVRIMISLCVYVCVCVCQCLCVCVLFYICSYPSSMTHLAACHGQPTCGIWWLVIVFDEWKDLAILTNEAPDTGYTQPRRDFFSPTPKKNWFTFVPTKVGVVLCYQRNDEWWTTTVEPRAFNSFDAIQDLRYTFTLTILQRMAIWQRYERALKNWRANK